MKLTTGLRFHFAPEWQVAGANDSYLSLFHGYIVRSLATFYDSLLQAGEVASSEREQAWHLLDYGLKLPAAWSHVREMLLALAPQMERAGFRDDWLAFLVRGIACSQQAQDLATEIQLALYAGRLHRLRGAFDAAQQWFEHGVKQAQILRDRRSQAIALNQLAYLARLQGHYPAAQTHVAAAQALLEPGDLEWATSYSWLGAIAYDQMDWEGAVQHYQQAYAIWHAAADRQRAAWSLQNLGNTLRNAGRYTEAADYIRQSIVILDEVQDPVNQAIARMGLGTIYEELGRAEEALALYRMAEQVFREVRDDLHLAMIYNNQAVAYRALMQWSAAEKAALAGVQLWSTIGDLKSLANNLDELGLAYLGQARFSEAIAAFQRGLELLASVPPTPFGAMIHQMLFTHCEEANVQMKNAQMKNVQLKNTKVDT